MLLQAVVCCQLPAAVTAGGAPSGVTRTDLKSQIRARTFTMNWSKLENIEHAKRKRDSLLADGGMVNYSDDKTKHPMTSAPIAGAKSLYCALPGM